MISARYCTCVFEREYTPLHRYIQCCVYHPVLQVVTYLRRSAGVLQLNLLQGTKTSKKCCGGPYAVKGTAWSKLCLRSPNKESRKSSDQGCNNEWNGWFTSFVCMRRERIAPAEPETGEVLLSLFALVTPQLAMFCNDYWACILHSKMERQKYRLSSPSWGCWFMKTAWISLAFRIAPKQVLTLNLSMIVFLNRDASLKWAKAVQNWSQRQLYNGLCFEFVLT